MTMYKNTIALEWWRTYKIFSKLKNQQK